MYAAYSYENVRDDELSFHKGECLRVLERDGEERSWWLCERISRGAQDSDSDSSAQRRGLVPRNYLSLYPTLSDRSDSFTMFDLPTVTSSVDGGGNSANKSLQETNSVNIINHNNVINIVDCEDNNNNNKNTNNNLSTNVIKIDLNDQMCNSENEQIPPALLSVS
ncbi:unnamed protein product [Anisakis simplex]|uniref:Apoptotic enhancer 1 protein (inferred by orthology to a C. elegans protein) n=1 Tax=Anisakis simplex TaxID=6269 RepID=A0A0M3KIX3_ANISI|nr:unnamed protein product [Anisakis simplex]